MTRSMLCLVGFGLLALGEPAAAEVCADRSAELLAALQHNDFDAARTHFSPKVAQALDASRLRQVWEQALPQMVGVFDHADSVTVSSQAGVTVAVTPLYFSKGNLSMKVACDSAGQIDALLFAPATKTVADAGLPLPPGAREQPLAVDSPLGPLPGVLTLPAGKGPFPTVLLVAGSGAHDKDETIGLNRPFRDIAVGLAAAGIASLRYDKRTLTYALRMVGRPIGIDDEVTNDALTALKQLAAQPQIDPKRLFVLGHSLGAMMAPRIAQRDPHLAGVILLAAPARTLIDVSAQQAREQGQRAGASAAQIAASEQAIVDERSLLAKADPRQPPPGMFGGALQSYWLSLFDYDQVSVAEHLSMPMLFLQGAADFQVSPTADFARWRQVLAEHTNVAFHLYSGLSHLFMPAGTTGTVKDYEVPAHIDAQVVRDIAGWIQAQPSVRALATNHGE